MKYQKDAEKQFPQKNMQYLFCLSPMKMKCNPKANKIYFVLTFLLNNVGHPKKKVYNHYFKHIPFFPLAFVIFYGKQIDKLLEEEILKTFKNGYKRKWLQKENEFEH